MILKTREPDATHERLRKAVERKQSSYLWTPRDMITFTPRLLPVICGDGRALFTIATINQRPRYWVIRGCSTWGCGYDREDSSGPDFAELTDDLMSELEDHFGRGRCGYSGNSLFYPRRERIQWCECEECDEKGWKASWPMVDDNGGCSWSRMDWPEGFATVRHWLSWEGNLLDNQPRWPSDVAVPLRPLDAQVAA